MGRFLTCFSLLSSQGSCSFYVSSPEKQEGIRTAHAVFKPFIVCGWNELGLPKLNF